MGGGADTLTVGELSTLKVLPIGNRHRKQGVGSNPAHPFTDKEWRMLPDLSREERWSFVELKKHHKEHHEREDRLLELLEEVKQLLDLSIREGSHETMPGMRRTEAAE